MPKPKHYTAEEVRKMLLDQMKTMCGYWSSPAGRRGHNTELERMEGLCFSILNIFDGNTFDLPAMDICLAPHKDDKQYLINRGERWFKPGMVINNCQMHEEWHEPEEKNETSKPMKEVTIKLSKEDRERLEAEAKERGKTLEEYASEILTAKIEEQA